ncbi:hemolysin activation/secretion protein [Polymorphobacter multimanifer]|uniref:Hemolysin activation/secretion protein n=2 Tax=Polymorphobacter multimanifer TaxID=1070431 RepID=A0A841LE47_9SPHN|nr:ShlB/FhaC/HecB family hemolysin secretion/activation protein [Polymorphobacter multimanifer]MBB6228085.1 hemolysin activation/secretion protein [Polymorphobacter multimanifer]
MIGLILSTGAEAALAQQLPSAGGQLRQLPPPAQMTPVNPELRIERPAPAVVAADAGPAFSVSAIAITGMTVFSESELRSVTGFVPGASLSLGDLNAMAARITSFYAARGYFVAQAYLPAQAVADGTVTIAVIEGRYGAVTTNNTTRVANGVVASRLAGLDSGDIVANRALERRLLLLSDVPGTLVKSTLSPGAETGTADLRVDVTPGRSITGSIDVDNGGNRYTGYYRAGGSLNFNNPLGLGDVLSVRGLVSDGGLTYVRGAYQLPVGALTLGVAYARLDYSLGKEFEALDAHGSADIFSVFASYPLLRTYDYNVYLLAAADFKFFHDEVDTTNSVIDRRSQVGSLGLSGDGRDASGSSFWSIGWSMGNLDIRTPAVRAIDAVTARSNGGFHKLNLAAGRNQSLTENLSLYLFARGQLASKNLDISEKMQLGGAYGVRAYPEGEGFGDQGYIVTAEARLRLAGVSDAVPGDVSLVAFVDHGGVTFNRNRFSPADNSTSLSGAGGGIAWADNGNFQVRASYAHRLGNQRVTSGPDASGQFWFQASKFF